MRSAVYEGVVVHHRRSPVDHRFTYRVAMPLVDLDEIDDLCALHPLWSNGGRNVVSYRRRDYLPGGTPPLADAVRDLVGQRLGRRPSGPVAMLAQPRTWGWLFNPIALYYCFDPSGSEVEALVAEVTNTPWHERHAYVVGAPGRHRLDKALHVSPFLDMAVHYDLAYGTPGRHLAVGIDVVRGTSTVFGARMHLERRHADRRALGRLLVSHPFMTIRVSAGIYRQAFSLWRARVPFVPHPRRTPAPGCQAGLVGVGTGATQLQEGATREST